MKKMKRFTALLLVLAMMVAMLAGCGEKKTAAESFFELYDEIYAQQYTDSTADMTLALSGGDMDNVTVDAALNMLNNSSDKTGVISGTIGVSGVSLTIPEITVTEDTLYLDGKATADLLTLLGVDSDGTVAALIGSSAIAMDVTSGETAVDPQKLVDLVSGTAEKVKADLLAREGAIVEDEENKGTYILTIDGALYLELFQLVMADVIANQDAYIQVILEYAAEDEALAAELDETTLKDFFTELETAMSELETSEDAAELRAFFDSVKMVVKIGKDADKNYQIAISLEMTVEETAMVMNVDETVKPLSEAPAIEIPAETVSAEEVIQAAVSAYYGYSSDYEEDYTYGGTAVKTVVPDGFVWDDAYISAELTDVSGSDADYNYYASYGSVDKEYFDLEESMGSYYSFFEEEDGTNPMTMTEVVPNGAASAVAIYGTTEGYELYDVTITVDCGDDELAYISVSAYDTEASGVADVLAYYGLELPQ
ncbi:MAG: hypothetical protein IJX71_00975 [Oscillospiraceae bacterium]|nr:hypothetical protein [Oscillospiraceae bacterium]